MINENTFHIEIQKSTFLALFFLRSPLLFEKVLSYVDLTILSSLEASFRIDYLLRCYNKKKDKISRRFRDIHNDKGSRISLDGTGSPELWTRLKLE